MQKIISGYALVVATFMLLLMSAIPHHHHCTEPDGARHVDFICFSSVEHEEESAEDEHAGENVHLHSIVTVSERTLDVMPYFMAAGSIVPEIIFPEIPVGESTWRAVVPVSVGTESSAPPDVRSLRAPPALFA